MQAAICDNRYCDYRRFQFYGRVTNDQIRDAIRNRGLTLADVADELQIDENKVSKSLSGKRRWQVAEMDALRRMLGDDAAHEPATRALPVIGLVSAGNWREAVQHAVDFMPAPDPRVPPRAVALRVTGDSMDLYVDDGGTVVIDPDDRALYPDRFYVVSNGEGETTFKQFKADPARLVPCSTNPAHQEIVIGGDQRFEVIARVIWRASRM